MSLSIVDDGRGRVRKIVLKVASNLIKTPQVTLSQLKLLIFFATSYVARYKDI